MAYFNGQNIPFVLMRGEKGDDGESAYIEQAWEDITSNIVTDGNGAYKFTPSENNKYDRYEFIVAIRAGTGNITLETKIDTNSTSPYQPQSLGKVLDISLSIAQLMCIDVEYVGRWLFDVKTTINSTFATFDPTAEKNKNIPLIATTYNVHLVGNPSATKTLDKTVSVVFSSALPEGSKIIGFARKVVNAE